jgi:hypothetical protein
LSGYCLRRLLSRHSITAHNPAALGTETGIDHQNCIDFIAPARLVKQGDLNQNQRCPLEADLLQHRYARQGMKKGVDLSANLRIIEDALSQGNTVDRSIGVKKGLAVGGTKGVPTRPIDIQQVPAALINVNERHQAIASQQTAYTTFSRSYPAGYTENKGFHWRA